MITENISVNETDSLVLLLQSHYMELSWSLENLVRKTEDTFDDS